MKLDVGLRSRRYQEIVGVRLLGGELVAWVEANYKTSVQRFHSGYSAVNPAAAWCAGVMRASER